jgi:hypothetical protein
MEMCTPFVAFLSLRLLPCLALCPLRSKECQVEDWPLHKLMCHTDRHTYAEDGSVIPVGSSAVAAADRAPSSSEKKPAVPTADYISESEMDDKALFSFVMDKLQLQTNPFALLQVRFRPYPF